MLLLGDISVYKKLYNHRIEMKNLLSVKSDYTPKDGDITIYAGSHLENCIFTSKGLISKQKEEFHECPDHKGIITKRNDEWFYDQQSDYNEVKIKFCPFCGIELS